MCSLMQTTKGIPASTASIMASGANGPGTKMMETFAAVSRTAWATVLNTGAPHAFLSAATGRYARYDVRAVLHHLFRVERAFTAGDALHKQACVLVDEDAHQAVATLTTSCDAACMASAATRPASCRIARPSS